MDAVLEAELEADRAAAQLMDEREQEAMRSIRLIAKQAARVEREAKALQEELQSLVEIGADEELRRTLAERLSRLTLKVLNLRAQTYELVSWAMNGRHTPEEVQAWCDRATDMGCVRPTLGTGLISDLIRHRRVPNAPLRAALEYHLEHSEEDETACVRAVHHHLSQMERETGLGLGASGLVTNGHPVGRTLRRMLGIEPTPPGPNQDRPNLRLFIGYEQAVAISRALGITPIEAGV